MGGGGGDKPGSWLLKNYLDDIKASIRIMLKPRGSVLTCLIAATLQRTNQTFQCSKNQEEKK